MKSRVTAAKRASHTAMVVTDKQIERMKTGRKESRLSDYNGAINDDRQNQVRAARWRTEDEREAIELEKTLNAAMYQ